MHVRRASTPTALLLAALVAVLPARSDVLAEPAQVLRRIFPPPATLHVRTFVLTETQAQRAAASAGAALPTRIVKRHAAVAPDGGILGYAYTDTHLVRTLPETLLIVIDAGGRVRRVEVLSFDEPREYLASPRWLAQFEGHDLDPELQLKRSIRALSGASLSARAATDAVRRALALHRELPADPAEPQGTGP